MADDKKSDKSDKPKKSGGSGPGDLTYFIAFLIVLFILWVFSGGPQEHASSRNRPFINTEFKTYDEPFWGQPGSVTNTLPFLR